MTQQLPSIIAAGAYELRKHIGEGGMADVYEAFDLKLRRRRAVKILKPAFSQSRQLRGRLEVEAQAMAQLEDHPHVLRVFAQGVDGDCYYIVMEFIDGQTVADAMWSEKLGRYMPLALPTIGMIVRAVLRALAAAHEANIVHRDIKGENIMLPKSGGVKVMDFGIAQSGGGRHSLTKTGVAMGSPLSCSPEQTSDPKSVDLRADIYAVGVLLYTMLTGDEQTAHMFKMIEDEERMSKVPDEFLAIICKAVAYRREDRYQSAGEFLLAFNAACALQNTDMLTELRPTPLHNITPRKLEEVPVKTSTFKPWQWLLVVLGVLMMVGVGAGIAKWPRVEVSQLEPQPEVTAVATPVVVQPIVIDKPLVVTQPKPLVVTPKAEVKPKGDVVKNEVQPKIVEAPHIVAPAVSGSIGSGNLTFMAELAPVNQAATCTLIYRVGSDPKWQRKRMLADSAGLYKLVLDVDKDAEKVEYVIEISQEGQPPLRSGSAQNPHVLKP